MKAKVKASNWMPAKFCTIHKTDSMETLMHWGFVITKSKTELKLKNVKLLWRTEEFSPVWKHSVEMASCFYKVAPKKIFPCSHLEKHSCCNLKGLQSGNAKRNWIIEVLPSSPKRKIRSLLFFLISYADSCIQYEMCRIHVL